MIEPVGLFVFTVGALFAIGADLEILKDLMIVVSIGVFAVGAMSK